MEITRLFLFPNLILETLKTVIGLCVVDASVREICTKGDSLLTEETGKVSFFWKVPNKKIKPKKAKKKLVQ